MFFHSEKKRSDLKLSVFASIRHFSLSNDLLILVTMF